MFWAFRRFWIDLLGIEPARWLLEVPSGWKHPGQMGSLEVIWCQLIFLLTVVTPLTFSSLFKSGFFPLFHPTGKFKIIEFDWSTSCEISEVFFSDFWSSGKGATKSGTTCASVCFFECSISISDPNLISWALLGVQEPVQSSVPTRLKDWPRSGPFLIINELALCEGSTRSKSRIIFSVISFNLRVPSSAPLLGFSRFFEILDFLSQYWVGKKRLWFLSQSFNNYETWLSYRVDRALSFEMSEWAVTSCPMTSQALI